MANVSKNRQSGLQKPEQGQGGKQEPRPRPSAAVVEKAGLFEKSESEIEKITDDETVNNPVLEQSSPTNSDPVPTDPASTTKDIGDGGEDEPYGNPNWGGGGDGGGYVPVVVAEGESLTEHLVAQLNECKLTNRQRAIVEQVMGWLNSSGFLPLSPISISSRINTDSMWQDEEVTEAEVREAVKLLQSFSPTGVASRDLQEFWLKQLEELRPDDDTPLLKKMVTDYYHLLKDRPKLAEKLKVDDRRMRHLMNRLHDISSLPTADFNTNGANVRSVDFTWESDPVDGQWTLTMCGRYPVSVSFRDDGTPQGSYEGNFNYGLRVRGSGKDDEGEETIYNPTEAEFDDSDVDVAEEASETDSAEETTDGSDSVAPDGDTLKDENGKTPQEKAQDFIDKLVVRRQTLMRVMLSIIKHQSEYFFNNGGLSSLVPLTQRAIAQELKLNESTVSRCVSTRHIQMPDGVKPLSDFFPAANPDGPTGLAVMEAIDEIIAGEDHANPLSDDAIRKELKAKYQITTARRTVTKYRERLGLPGATDRKRNYKNHGKPV